MEPVRVEPVRARGHAVIGGSGAEEGRIDGVVVHPIALYPDDRGHFAEVFRDSDPVAEGFAVRQSSITPDPGGSDQGVPLSPFPGRHLLPSHRYRADRARRLSPRLSHLRSSQLDLRGGALPEGGAHPRRRGSRL